MRDSTRRRFLRTGGVVGIAGLTGCSQITGGNDIKDTDGDGVIDSEDYAPRDPSVQDAEDVEDNNSDEDQESEDSDEDPLILRAALNGSSVTNRANIAADLNISAQYSPTTGVSGEFDNAWGFSRNLSASGPDAVTFEIPSRLDFDFSGSDDFSVKGHFNPSSASIDGPGARRGSKDHPNPFLFQARGNPAEISVQYNDAGNGEVKLRIESGDREDSIFTPTGVRAPVGEWTSYVLTWDSSNEEANLYINGNNELTERAGTPFSTETSSNTISGFGARAGRDDKGFDGRMDELQIYNTTLDQEQVQTLHTQATL